MTLSSWRGGFSSGTSTTPSLALALSAAASRKVPAASIAVRRAKLSKILNMIIGHSGFGPHGRSAENGGAALQKYFSYR